MKVFLSCSSELTTKLNQELLKMQIDLAPETMADYALVQSGFDCPNHLISIVFDPLDYPQALGLLTNTSESPSIGTDRNWYDSNMITGTAGNRFALIPIEDILYIEANGNDVICITPTTSYELKNPLYHYEGLLLEKGFVRINKSQMVNLVQTKEIIPWFNGRLVVKLSDTLQLEVSKTYAKRLRKSLDL